MARIFFVVLVTALFSGGATAAPELVFPAAPAALYLRAGEAFRVRLAIEGATGIRWFLVSQDAGPFDNAKVCGPGTFRGKCHERIGFSARELVSVRGLAAFEGALVPELARLGTKRLAVSYLNPSGERREWPAGSLDGGDVEDFIRVPEVVVRSDDSYAGMLTELIGQPFVFYPVRLPALGWQTDLRAGGDCVALVIYGQRRLGSTYSYKAPRALRRDLRARFTGLKYTRLSMDPAKAVPVRRGDVLHFGFQTAVVYSADGMLGPDTLIIQSFYDGVAIKKFSELPYRDYDFDVLTWPSKKDRSPE